MEKIINWDKYELRIRDFESSHENGGRLGKIWAEDTKSGRMFLIKGSGKFGYEPFSEKLSYIVGKNLGIDVLEYDLIPAELFEGLIPVNSKCPYLSICEKIDKERFSIASIAEIKRARNVVIGDKNKAVRNREVMYEILPREYIDTMFLLDAITGNEDRHYGNVHIVRGLDGTISGAPILDNGASLLATRTDLEIMLAGKRVGEIFNRSFTIDTTHDKQLKTTHLRNIDFDIPAKTVQILNEIQPTLDLMTPLRAKAIKQYLVFRLHKYLGMIKYSDSEEYFEAYKMKGKSNRTTIDKPEHKHMSVIGV